MPKQRKPTWVPPRGEGRKGYWRTIIDKVPHYNYEIPRDERPQLAGIPVRAWNWLSTIEGAQKRTLAEAEDPTAGQLFRLYAVWARGEVDAGRLSAGQFTGIKSRLKLLLRFSDAATVKARNFGADHVGEFFDHPKIRRYSPLYRVGIGATLRACFHWGARPIRGREPTRILADNPLAGYAFPRAPKAVRGYVEGAVVRRFLRWAWAKGRRMPPAPPYIMPKELTCRFDRLFVLMLRFQRLTGCRPGEACDLQWADIRWEENRAVLPPDRHKTGKKTGKDRVIYLTRPVIRLLRAIERLPGRHEVHVFTHMRGKGAVARGHYTALAGEPWPEGKAASKRVGKLRKAAIADNVKGVEGVGPRKLVAYANRHGYASEALALGASNEETAALIGNTAAVIASTYAHSVTEAEAALARDLVERRRGLGRTSS